MFSHYTFIDVFSAYFALYWTRTHVGLLLWCTNVAAEAQQILVEGSAEWRVFHGIPDEGATHDAMEEKLGKEVFKVRDVKHQHTLLVIIASVCTHPCSH
jgi:hypothetical protein